jgi:hypothetical protein
VLDGGRVLTNNSTLTWTGGTIELNQGTQAGAGTINNLVGSTWNDSGAGAKLMRSAFGTAADNALAAFNNAGTYTKSGAGTTSIGANFNNSATVNVQAGTLALQDAGGFVNNGLVSLGATGTLNVLNRFENPSTGTTEVSIASATQFGRLNVSGTGQAVLNGTLRAAFVNGFVPPANSFFPFLTFTTRSGLYANVTSTGLPPGTVVTQDTTLAGTLRIKVG